MMCLCASFSAVQGQTAANEQPDDTLRSDPSQLLNRLQHDSTSVPTATSPVFKQPIAEEQDNTRIWIVGGTLAAVDAAVMTYYFSTFYAEREDQRSKFHTFNDWYNPDLNVDKIGHIWGAQAYTVGLYHIFKWAGLNETNSMIWSSTASWLFQIQMEVTDGFYERWGFSWWDVGANTLGAVYPNLQRIYEPLQSVHLKMAYYPSEDYRKGWIDYPLKDYDGFTYWLSFTVEDFLPQSWKPYWPDWLAVAVGYGANEVFEGPNDYNVSPDNVGLGEQEWYIGLDYDLKRLPGDSDFMIFLKESLNLIRLPAPAIRITPSGIYYAFFFTG